jgi:hypothetical protein
MKRLSMMLAGSSLLTTASILTLRPPATAAVVALLAELAGLGIYRWSQVYLQRQAQENVLRMLRKLKAPTSVIVCADGSIEIQATPDRQEAFGD